MDFSIILTIPLIILFGYIVTNLFHELALDWYREYLFSLRSELFDYVCEKNECLFDSGAYRSLEERINGTIHFAEMLKPSLIGVFMLKLKRKSTQHILNIQHESEKEFIRDLKNILDESDSRFMKKISKRVEESLAIYIVLSSWMMMSLVLVVGVFSATVYGLSYILSRLVEGLNGYPQKIKDLFMRTCRNGLRLVEASAGSYSSRMDG